MSGDLLFPFPEPTFLFVHDVYLFGPDQIVRELDERGKEYTRIAQEGDVNYPEPVKGYLTAPDAQRDTSGYMQREGIEAVLLLPNGLGIDQGWVIKCQDPQLPPHLAGAYDVFSTRPNISHNRVMLKRFRKQWGRWPGGD